MAWRGDNNNQPNNVNLDPSVSEKKPEVNRSLEIRRDTDKNKGLSITLLDIDTVILNHLESTLNLQVVDNGEKIKVPIFFGSPEKWKSIKKDGYMRDPSRGKLILPAIMFKRNTVENNAELMPFNRYLSYPIYKQYSEKNKYDNFSLIHGNYTATKEYYFATIPDHVIITYDFMVWTEYVTQMNTIIETINFSENDYWGDPKRYRFKVKSSNYTLQTDNPNEEDRLVRATFSLTVWSYLLPEKFENYKETVQKAFSPKKVIFNTSVVSDLSSLAKRNNGNGRFIPEQLRQSYTEKLEES